MSKFSDREYLMTDQYRNASNLGARQRLHDRFSTNKRGWHLWVFDQFNLPPESTVLELGCGSGVLWSQNARRIPDGWDITLSDLSLGMLRDARQNLWNGRVSLLANRRVSQYSLKFVTADAQSIPFEGESFDGVIANHMLYHVPDVAKAISEIYRILKPRGCFYAATNGRGHMRELGELVRRFDPNIGFKSGNRSFSLENGLIQISRWFPEVNLRRYEDSLAITEVDPLVDYVLSTMSNARAILVGDRLEEFVDFVEREMALHGVIKIAKDVGMFDARRGTGG